MLFTRVNAREGKRIVFHTLRIQTLLPSPLDVKFKLEILPEVYSLPFDYVFPFMSISSF